ncbi:hypothetical protein FHETE_7672 [Fusarium heterosporum]|uniref:Uncharacterized protein n=1 Tax=Fusarium heterosporum TaxID=42747 RepID=A0A8H5T5S4_FUSHE|nr:hypothetical protein FHETE_7672 [Fusarium heterosporum]
MSYWEQTRAQNQPLMQNSPSTQPSSSDKHPTSRLSRAGGNNLSVPATEMNTNTARQPPRTMQEQPVMQQQQQQPAMQPPPMGYAMPGIFFQHQEARVTSFLSNSERMVQTQTSALQQVRNQLANITNSFGNTVGQWLRHPATNEASSLYREIKKSRRRFATVNEQNQQLRSEKEALEKQLAESALALTNAIEERDEQRRLVESANWPGSVKVSDDVIKSKWKQLHYNIRSMARTLAKCPVRLATDRVVIYRLSLIVDKCDKIIADDNYKELIIQAYLWIVVHSQIFKERGNIRDGGHLCGLKTVRDELIELASVADEPGHSGPSIRHVARWSAQGASLFVHFLGRDSKVFKQLLIDETKKLGSFCKIVSRESETGLLLEMKGILETALDLDDMLMSSKAIFWVHWALVEQSDPAHYIANEMEAVAYSKELTPKTSVKFEVSPMLVKMGNADGCNYGSSMVLSKALVVCE